MTMADRQLNKPSLAFYLKWRGLVLAGDSPTGFIRTCLGVTIVIPNPGVTDFKYFVLHLSEGEG